MRRVAAAISELRAAGGRVTLVVLSDRPVDPGFGRELGELPPQGVENYGYVGDRDSYMDLLRRGDLFVHLSQAEGVPTVVVDALAAGLPVVASESDASKEILGDGKRGRVVASDDPHSLMRVIGALLDDPNERATLRESALQWAAANTAEVHATRFGDRVRDLFPSLDW